jgi:hypothetical protein
LKYQLSDSVFAIGVISKYKPKKEPLLNLLENCWQDSNNIRKLLSYDGSFSFAGSIQEVIMF